MVTATPAQVPVSKWFSISIYQKGLNPEVATQISLNDIASKNQVALTNLESTGFEYASSLLRATISGTLTGPHTGVESALDGVAKLQQMYHDTARQ